MPDPLVYTSEGIIRDAGAERVDEKASYVLAEKLEEHGKKVIHHAFLLLKRTRRKRIKARDIEVAAQLLME